MDLDIVDLSRLQFAVTALYHFLFVPLTIGLAVIIAIMETVFVMTGRTIWRDMTKFWGTLFGINFAMGVATGIVMEFQFGMNWSYYSHYVGDIFGAPLAIEGLMAFFLEATFVGLFFFGWDRLSKVGHLVTTWCVALGSNFSALWILIANGWMQNPVGAAFNPQTMRMEVTDFFAVLTNPVAQAKFVHTVSAGYVTAAIFVLGVSAWYLLKGRHIQLARRSMTVATSFGLAAALSTADGLLLTISNALVRDLYVRARRRRASPEQRVILSKFALLVVALSAAFVASRRSSDILPMVTASFSLAASAFVPAMVLGIFWRGTTRRGAVAGMLAGLGITVYYMVSHVPALQPVLPEALHARLWWGIQPISSGVFGVPAGLLVTWLVSCLDPRRRTAARSVPGRVA